MNVEVVGYAMGWVENCLEKNLEETEGVEEKKYAKELYDSYMIVSNGLTELANENAELRRQLQQIRNAIG